MFVQPSVMAESDDLCFSKIEGHSKLGVSIHQLQQQLANLKIRSPNKIEEISLQNGSCEAVKDKNCMDPIGNDVLDEISLRNSSSSATGNDDGIVKKGSQSTCCGGRGHGFISMGNFKHM